MNARWHSVPLSKVALPIKRSLIVEAGQSYRTIGVKWWGEGAYERQTIDGAATAARTLSLVRRGDLIINKIWVRNGSTAVAGEEVDGCVASGEFPTFELDGSQVVSRWLHWLTKTRSFWSQCDRLSRGTSGKNRIKPDLFLSIHIPLPQLEEQRDIVAKLDAAADAVTMADASRTRASAALSAVHSSETTRVFDGLAGSPQVELAELGPARSNPVQTGPFGAQLHASEFIESGTPVLNVGNVWPKGLDLSRLDFVSAAKAKQLTRYVLLPDDLLFARSGATLGKVCIVPSSCSGWLMSGHLFRVRLDQGKLHPSFAFAGFAGAESIRRQVFGQVRGATRPGFNTTLLSRVRFPLPPLAEQRRVVDHLNALQTKIDQASALGAKAQRELAALMPSLLDRAFRGEL